MQQWQKSLKSVTDLQNGVHRIQRLKSILEVVRCFFLRHFCYLYYYWIVIIVALRERDLFYLSLNNHNGMAKINVMQCRTMYMYIYICTSICTQLKNQKIYSPVKHEQFFFLSQHLFDAPSKCNGSYLFIITKSISTSNEEETKTTHTKIILFSLLFAVKQKPAQNIIKGDTKMHLKNIFFRNCLFRANKRR